MREIMTRLSESIRERWSDPEWKEDRLGMILTAAVAMIVIIILLLLLGYYVWNQKEGLQEETVVRERVVEKYMSEPSEEEEALRQEYLANVAYLGEKVQELLENMTLLQEELKQVSEQTGKEEDALQEQIHTVQQQVSQLVQELKETQVQLYDLTDLIQVLNVTTIPLIQQQLAEVQTQMVQMKTDITTLYSKIAALEKEDERLWAGIQGLEEKLTKTLDGTVNDMTSQIEQTNQRIEEMLGRTLQYRYDAQTNTLYLMPGKE